MKSPQIEQLLNWAAQRAVRMWEQRLLDGRDERIRKMLARGLLIPAE